MKLTESEKGSKLDTLPEEKSHHSPSQVQPPTAIPTIQTTSAEPYRRVYPEWKPSSTLEKTDVVGTIETLAGMTCKTLKTQKIMQIMNQFQFISLAISDVQTHARDKSAWRKSNLNVSNSSEEAESDARRCYRRQRSREGSITSISGSPLHSILEEDKKKNPPPIEKIQTHSRNSSDSSSEATTPLIADSNLNKQSIYIRPPIEESIQSPTNAKHNSSIYIRPFESDPLSSLEDQPNVPSRVRRSYLNETNNKIEIDSDNIETPPTVRKNFNHHPSSSSNSERTSSIASHKNIKPPRPLHKTEDEGDKKIQTKNEPEVLGDGQFDRFSSARRTRRFKRPIDLSSATEDIGNAATTSPDSISDASFPILTPTNLEVSPVESKVEKPLSPTKKTESKHSEAPQTKESKNKVNSDVVSRIGKIGKSISRISQEDVREAIRSLKSPTPEREWNAKDVFRVGPMSSKIISHELNDEGFEETQSLVSDTPSLTTSSCNEEAKTKPSRLASADNTTTPSGTPKRRQIRASNQLQTLIARNQQSLERSRSLRVTPPVSAARSVTSTPRRTASLRRPETSQQTLSLPKSLPNRRLDVERSNSRTSLRSSRSSLNSAVSTNTVKKMPLKPSTSTSSASSLPKRPLVLQNSSTTSTPIRSITRVPASRSSSSGSSIGPTVRKPPTPSASSRLSSTISTSFKENQNNRSKISPASSAASTKTNGSGGGLKSASPAGRSSSFMRPTAASATKVKSK